MLLSVPLDCSVNTADYLKVNERVFVQPVGSEFVVGFVDDPFTSVEISGGVLSLLASCDGTITADKLQSNDPHGAAGELGGALAALVQLGLLNASDRPIDALDSSTISANRGAEWLPTARVSPYADILTTNPDIVALYNRIRPRTYVTPAMLLAVTRSLDYVKNNAIEGSVVECGVWRGGLLRAMAERLTGEASRELWGYDTFSATWEAPGADDALLSEPTISLASSTSFGDASDPLITLSAVNTYVLESGISAARLRLVEGLVQDTLPRARPSVISLLHLDTDLYESTRVELEALYPLVSPGGVVIVDDYGKWAGATRAVDDYFNDCGLAPLIQRIEGQGCLIIAS